jgi:type I restriction enzyme S subunit
MTNPLGWSEVRLDEVAEVRLGRQRSPDKAYGDNLVPYLRAANVRWGGLDLTDVKSMQFSPEEVETFRLRRDDILVVEASGSRDEVGKSALWREELPLVCLQNTLIRVRPRGVDPAFLRWHLHLDASSGDLGGASKGIGIHHIGAARLAGWMVNVPPLNEQRRIVDKLSAIFERTRAAKARLERLPTLFDTLRRSIWAAAFRGDLTTEWRTANPISASSVRDAITRGVDLPPGAIRGRKQARADIAATDLKLPKLPASWTYCSVRDLYESRLLIDFADGNHGSDYPRASEFGDDGIPFVTATQVTDDGRVLVAAAPRLNQEKANTLRKGWAIGGDVLLTHNATVGRVAQVPPGTKPFLLGTSATFYRPHPHWLDSGFLSGFFASPAWQNQLERVMRQTTRNQVSIQRQEPLLIAVAPIAEQHEISRLLSTWLGALEALQAHLGLVTRISELERTALAKAFRGELVDQDPSDEPAAELLARIRAAVSNDEPPSRSERVPRARSARTKTRSTATTASARTRSRTSTAEPR